MSDARQGEGGWWGTLGGVLVAPARTLHDLETNPHGFGAGIAALAIVSGIYTIILAVFIVVGYPAVAPSVLPVTAVDQYHYQVWYQAPLFFVTTFIAGAVLTGLARASRRTVPLRVSFARIGLATAVPFGCTTMLVELTLAILMGLGVIEPRATLSWLTDGGAGFAAAYQIVAMVWMVVLLVLSARSTLRRGWPSAVGAGLLIAVIYGLPIALFIR